MPAAPESFRRSQLAIAALFFLLGFQYSTWVSRVPALRTQLDLGAADVGLLLLAPGVGVVVSFPLVAWLTKRLGPRRLAAGSALVLCVLLAALAVVRSFPAALLVLSCDGVAVSCLNVAMNAKGAALERRHQRKTMAKLHAMFSGGMFCAAVLASGVMAVDGALPVHFAVADAVLLTLLGLSWADTSDDGAQPATQVMERQARGRRWQVPAQATVLLSLAMVFGELTEGAMHDWSALYLQDVAHAAAELAPLGISFVSATMLLARLFADGWRDRWGDKPVAIAGAVLAASGLAVALLLGGVTPAFAGFFCVGLGMGAVTPCVYVAAARLGPDSLSFVASMGTTGLLVGPPIIGFVAGVSSLAWGLSVVVAAALLVAMFLARLPSSSTMRDDEPQRPSQLGPAETDEVPHPPLRPTPDWSR